MKILLSSALGLLFLVGGRAADAVEILKEVVKGDQAVVSFSNQTPLTCEDGAPGSQTISATLIANDLVQRSDFFPQIVDQVDIFFFSQNTCTEESAFANGVIQSPNFKISAQQRASVSGSVTLTDFFSGASLGTVTFNLKFTGVGAKVHSQDQQRLEFGDVTLLLRSVGSFREADVTGSFTFNGLELIDSATGGSLGRSRSGAIQMTR